MKRIYLFSIRARRTGAALLLLAITSVLGTAQIAAAASPSELLEQGIYSEETKGDVDAALKLYQQVVTEAKAGQAVAAQAQYRLGVCYYKKKNYAEANAAFREVGPGLPGSEGPYRARQQVPGQRHAACMPAPWVDGEEMQLDIKFPAGFKIGTACYRVNAGETNGQKTWRLRSHLLRHHPAGQPRGGGSRLLQAHSLPVEDQRDRRGRRDLFRRPRGAENDR